MGRRWGSYRARWVARYERAKAWARVAVRWLAGVLAAALAWHWLSATHRLPLLAWLSGSLAVLVLACAGVVELVALTHPPDPRGYKDPANTVIRAAAYGLVLVLVGVTVALATLPA